MEDAQDDLGQGTTQEELANDALESVGVGEPTESIVEESKEQGSTHMPGDGNSGKEIDLPLGVKERLGRQEKRHKRELRQLQQQVQDLTMQLNQPQTSSPQNMDSNYGQGNPAVDDQIHKAVSLALAAQDEQKRKAKEQESQHEVQKRYQNLQDHLDRGSDKFEDFDDVVRAQDAPYTPAMRDAALMLENPAEVLYKLGKNRDELKRIAQLHPLDQAREMVKLSQALMMGKDGDKNAPSARPIGQIKSNPVNPTTVNDKTPVSEIRRRMKAGDWKTQR